ncbi:hypothetical protein DdX_12761 [Ditylenchus destructor]|uniref:Uncharacterized protein n=1 Tax=Ditylenchus destructor TaxID=166010 RepID=A0AAD4MVY0_9BILA|nr:hypothetical protein DdX_12761 [Ditylenchus destructor]
MGAKRGIRFTIRKNSKRRAQPQPSIHKRFKRTASKKAKKKSGKSKKTSSKPICERPALRNYALKVGILRDTMSSFTRREICGLAEVDRRSNAVVDSDFPKAPYLTLPYIACHKGQWRWSPNPSILNVYLNGNQKFAKAKPIHQKRPIPTFLRFEESYFGWIPTGDLVKALSVFYPIRIGSIGPPSGYAAWRRP